MKHPAAANAEEGYRDKRARTAWDGETRLQSVGAGQNREAGVRAAGEERPADPMEVSFIAWGGREENIGAPAVMEVYSRRAGAGGKGINNGAETRGLLCSLA